MSEEQNTALFRRFYDEVVNQGRIDVVDEIVGPDLRHHTPLAGQATGAEGYKRTIAALREAFPDVKMVAEDLIAGGEKVVGRFRTSATHVGEVAGMAPTGKFFEVDEILIVTIREGRIVELWTFADRLSMMEQIGAIDTPVAGRSSAGR